MVRWSHAKRKLQGTGGASLLFAMLLLLLASIVACVILNAATTSLKTVDNDYETTQAQLTVDSTARLVKQQMSGFGVMVSGSGDSATFSLYPDGARGEGLTSLALDSFKQAYLNTGGYSATRPYQSNTFTLTASDSRFAAVTGVMSVYPAISEEAESEGCKSYDIRIKLTLQGADHAYSKVVALSQSVTSTAEGTLYQWSEPTVE